MDIKYDAKKIDNIINDFSLVSGIEVFFYDINENLISSSHILTESENISIFITECKEKKSLVKRISETHIYIALPVIKDGVISAYLSLKANKEYLNNFSKIQIDAFFKLLSDSLFSSAITVELPYALKKAVGYISLNLSDDLSLAVLCNISHCSKNMLYKLFDEAFGYTVNDYIVEKRIEAAKVLLETTRKSIKEIGKSVGMPSNAHFCRAFIKLVGMSPSAYRKSSK